MFRYNEPDKYEKWVGIKDVERYWTWDNTKQCWYQERNYPLEVLENIYLVGYRHPKFRGITIEDAFERVTSLPIEESENYLRVNWFLRHFDYGRLLDIGAGLGVFINALKTQNGWNVEASEENVYSRAFIRTGLQIPCHAPEDVKHEYDVVSAIHVLEHIEDTDSFLTYISDRLKPDGSVFIEVPDAVEFSYLPKDHDEFNSCHVWFFDVCSLYKLVSGHFRVTDIHRSYHSATKRSRIMLRAVKES